jgi:hypothetical protein
MKTLDFMGKITVDKPKIIDGIPYKGGKRKIARELVQFMRRENPDATVFVDLFGGGGAMSLCAAQYFDRVIYNEILPGVAALFSFLVRGGEIPHEWYKPVSRKEFFAHKDDPTPYGGFVRCCCSFGNNHKDYLYGKNVEKIKCAAAALLYDGTRAQLKEFNTKFGLHLPDGVIDHKRDIQERRKAYFTVGKQSKFQLQSLETLQRLQAIARLQRINKVCNFDNITCCNLDYRQVEIPPNAVVYCDIPYQNSVDKRGANDYGSAFSWDEFYNWARDVYVSEYACEHGSFVFETLTTVRMAATCSFAKTERLFKIPG